MRLRREMRRNSRLINTTPAEIGVMTPGKDIIFTGSHVVNGGAANETDDAHAAADPIETTTTETVMYAAKPGEVLSIPLVPVNEGMREADTERFFVEKLLAEGLAVKAIEAKHVLDNNKIVAALRIAFESEAQRDTAILLLQAMSECRGTKVSRCNARRITCRVVQRVGTCALVRCVFYL
jgi:hypothetical protein